MVAGMSALCYTETLMFHLSKDIALSKHFITVRCFTYKNAAIKKINSLKISIKNINSVLR